MLAKEVWSLVEKSNNKTTINIKTKTGLAD
jgi:hypothetical protein